MKELMIRFLNDIDLFLAPVAQGEQLKLYHIGRSSLVWNYGFAFATYDIDFLLPNDAERLAQIALDHFGHGTTKAKEFGIYLDLVDSSFPPTPPGYKKRATEIEYSWTVLRLFQLEPNDLAVTKLRRFAPKDREDIRQMCDLNLLDTAILQASLEKAFYYSLEKDGDRHRDAAFANLKTVQAYLSNEIEEF